MMAGDGAASSAMQAEAERHEGAAVAVLMCVHAGADADQFGEAVASMQAQTYAPLRLFIYCDGPLTDAHEVVLERLDVTEGADRILRGERPVGLPTGLNLLIDQSLAADNVTFMARMDADDISLPQRIEKQVGFLRAHADVAVVGSWCLEFNRPGVPLFHKKMPTEHADLAQFMLYRSPFNHPTVMFRREVFERGFRYDPTLKLMQDYDLWRRLAVAGLRFGNVPEALLWFRVEADFYTRRSGVRRATREIAMRISYARATRRLRLVNYPRYAGLFLVRVAPAWAKRLSYKYLRTF